MDSLINQVLDSRTYPGQDITGPYLEDKRIIVDIGKVGKGGLKFYVTLNDTYNINLKLNSVFFNTRKYVFFVYRGFKIFVWAEPSFYQQRFFSKIQQLRPPYKIHKLHYNVEEVSKLLRPGLMADYQYENGHFAPIIPPVFR